MVSVVHRGVRLIALPIPAPRRSSPAKRIAASSRATETSVSPSFRARSIASEVGAEIVTSAPAPKIAVFSTISKEARLVTEHEAAARVSAGAQPRADQLVQRVVAPRHPRAPPGSSRPHRTRQRHGPSASAGCSGWCRVSASSAASDRGERERRSSPVLLRRHRHLLEGLDAAEPAGRPAREVARGGPDARGSGRARARPKPRSPPPWASTTMSRISSTPRTMPSVRLKPATKSSRSAGLAIITA